MRHRWEIAIVLAMTLLAAACSSAADDTTTSSTQATGGGTNATTTSSGQPDDGTKQFDGVELTLLIHPTLFAASGGEDGIIREFEEATGATVTVVKAGLPELYDKMNIEFAAGSGAFDVFVYDNGVSEPTFWENMLPLNDLIANLPPEYDADDTVASLWEASEAPDGSQYGVPYRVGGYVIYYRSDLLDDLGYTEFPTTWPEFIELGRLLKTDNRSGAVQMGTNPEVAVEFISYLYAHNGRMLNDDWTQCALTEPEGVEAAETFLTIFTELELPEAIAYGRDDYIAAFQTGRAAMGMYFSPYWGRMTNPEESQIGQDVADAALMPSANGAPLGSARLALWQLGIDKNSENQEASMALIAALTNPENQLRMAVEFSNGPVRASVYESASFRDVFQPASLVLEALRVAVADPAHPATSAIRDHISTELQEAIAGQQTAAEAMDASCDRINRELSR